MDSGRTISAAMESEEVPLYPTDELARYLRMPPSTVRRWLSRGGRVHREANQLLSFEELISLLFVGELRLRHRVAFKDIFLAEKDLRSRIGRDHPFAWETLWTAGKDVLVRVPGSPANYVAANRLGQETLPNWAEVREVEVPALLLPLRVQIGYEDERAAVWRPAPHVTARPAVQYGLPCVDGSRLPTRTIARAVTAGDTPETVAVAYGVSLDGVRAAVGWEESLAA
jgi:uncharacterized protein (DUF433 family)